MTRYSTFALLLAAVVSVVSLSLGDRSVKGTAEAGEPQVSTAITPDPKPVEQVKRNPYLIDKVPPLPPGVKELKFSDLYKMPIGSRGLEFSDVVKGMDGKRVRILGYMIRSVHPSPRGFVLSPYPVTYDKCTADSIPTTAIHVQMPPGAKAEFTDGMLLLTGKLSLGSREDPFGQLSHVRLLLDPPVGTASQDTAASHNTKSH